MLDWYDRAVEELEEEYQQGNITYKVFKKEMKALQEEWRESQPLDVYDYMDRY